MSNYAIVLIGNFILILLVCLYTNLLSISKTPSLKPARPDRCCPASISLLSEVESYCRKNVDSVVGRLRKHLGRTGSKRERQIKAGDFAVFNLRYLSVFLVISALALKIVSLSPSFDHQ